MAIVHAWQLTPNGDWSPTSLLTAANASAMAAAQNEDGRIEIFYVDVLARLPSARYLAAACRALATRASKRGSP
jgi:hypothetical protein